MKTLPLRLLALLTSALTAGAAESTPRPAPTLANVPYGAHQRQVLDFWRAPSATPTPLVFYIHGGGWVNGNKDNVPNLAAYLAAGISVVSVNYRYIQQAIAAGVKPPVAWPIADNVRALQFVRHQAAAWNIDPRRIGASGGSAGACSSLWLALHADLADPRSTDPIARESTRLWCAAVSIAQTTLDPEAMQAWTPNSRYGGHAFGFWPDAGNLKTRDTAFAEFLAHRAEVLPWIIEYSPMEHATADDPPVYLHYGTAPALGQPQKDPTHTANFGVKLQEKLRALGVPCELVYPGSARDSGTHASISAYLIEKLKAPSAR
jgi:acetyl esterase/lipase